MTASTPRFVRCCSRRQWLGRALGLLALGVPVAAAGVAGLPESFDPARDAKTDLALACRLAAESGRRVIVDVGGEWCPWCHVMDRFFERRPDLRALRDARFVWLKINYSKANPNPQLLSGWPKVAGYPHLFVLDAKGALLHSQDTSALEDGDDYNAAAVRRFLTRWAAPGR
ncbi:MAG: thioredoxin family protein [Betaproteobacteria bacterium]